MKLPIEIRARLAEPDDYPPHVIEHKGQKLYPIPREIPGNLMMVPNPEYDQAPIRFIYHQEITLHP